MQQSTGFTCFRLNQGRSLPFEMHGTRALHCYKENGFELNKEEANKLFRDGIRQLPLYGQYKVKVIFLVDPLEFKFEFSSLKIKENLRVQLIKETEQWPKNNLVKNFDYTTRREQLDENPEVDEFLYYDERGVILDGSYSSFFALLGNKVFFGSAKTEQVLGVFRRRLMKKFKALGFEVIEREIQMTELSDFESVFLINDVQRIRAIKQVVSKDLLDYDLNKLSPVIKNVNDMFIEEEQKICQINLF